MSNKVKLRHRRELYSDPFLKVAEHTFDYQREEYRYFIQEEPEFAVVGAVTEDNQIIMVHQFRPGPREFLLDLPGGMVEMGDSPEETARKELREETGFEAGTMEYVTSSYPMAYSTAKKHIFMARGCRKVGSPEDEANMIAEPVLVSSNKFGEIVENGDVLDLDAMLILAQYLDLPVQFQRGVSAELP